MAVYEQFSDESMRPVMAGLMAMPLVSIASFYFFVSSSTSNFIAFTALVISITFIAISMWLLCWILERDAGPRSM
jgi:uncharacterized membrane protein